MNSQEAILLRQILDKLLSGSELSAALSNIQIDADQINLNTDQLESLLTTIDTKLGTTNTTLTNNTQTTRVTDGTDTLAINADGSINVAQSSAQRTVTSTSVTSSGTVSAGSNTVAFVSSSDFSGTVNGISFPASAAITFSAPAKDTLAAIPYTRTAGTLTIHTL